MKRPVHSVKPMESVSNARAVLERHRINQLPVVTDGKLVGIVTDRDLRDAFPSVLELGPLARQRRRHLPIDEILVEDVMARNVLTIGPDASVDEVATMMRRERIGAVPVLDHGRMVGIITRSDLLEAFVMRENPPAVAL
jgi:acetoin utilization protein AcuB